MAVKKFEKVKRAKNFASKRRKQGFNATVNKTKKGVAVSVTRKK